MVRIYVKEQTQEQTQGNKHLIKLFVSQDVEKWSHKLAAKFISEQKLLLLSRSA